MQSDTGEWHDAEGEEWICNMAEVSATLGKNEQKQKGVQCSARVEQKQHIKGHIVIVVF